MKLKHHNYNLNIQKNKEQNDRLRIYSFYYTLSFYGTGGQQKINKTTQFAWVQTQWLEINLQQSTLLSAHPNIATRHWPMRAEEKTESLISVSMFPVKL